MNEADNICLTCDLVLTYVGLANGFTQDLAATLLPGMWVLFGAIVGIWVILHGYMFVIASPKADLGRFVGELIPVIIASLLLHGQGPNLVNSIYYAALNTMGAAAGLALSVGGGIETATCDACSADTSGLVMLVATAERGLVKVFQIGDWIVKSGGWTDAIFRAFYALALVIPYVVVLIVFFSQVVIAIFRVLMIAALSPFLMLGFAFGWGRSMSVSGARTILASFMVLFGTTCALAVMLYGVQGLESLDDTDMKAWSGLTLVTPHYLVAVALGWMGTAFMTEATSIANSITGSVLSNSGLAILTGAGLGTAYGAARVAGSQAAQGAGSLHKLATYGAGYAGGAVSAGAMALVEKFKNHNGGFNK